MYRKAVGLNANEKMGAIKRIQYDCRQATLLIEKRQETTLTFKEWARLFIHLAGCSVCRLFQRQSRAITRRLHDFFRGSARRGHMLDEGFKREMQERINTRLGK
jgi:hypothetical protein